MKGANIFLLAICGLASLSAHSLSSSKKMSQFALDRWRTSDGLPEMAVQAIAQTVDGYLWVGTQEGLARFDGRRFVVFNHSNTPALKSDLIFALKEDNAGNLWIGTVTGVTVYSSNKTFRDVGIAGGMPVTSVSTITRDRDGSVWIGGLGGLAHVVAGSIVQTYSFNNVGTSDSNSVSSAAVDGDGSLWVVSQGRLYKLTHGKFDAAVDAEGGMDGPIGRLFLSRRGELWLLLQDGKLYRRREGKFEAWWPAGLPIDVQIRDMHEDDESNIWIATSSNGMFRGAEHGLVSNQAERIFADFSLLSLFEDDSKNLWIGTLGQGLLRIRDGVFTTFTKDEGLSSNNVYSVIQDRHGSIWTGTLDGLSEADNDKVRQFTQKDGLASNYISSLGAANDGGIWVGTLGASLAHIIADKVDRRVDLTPPQRATKVTALFEDARNQLWIGTDGAGIARQAANVTRYFSIGRGFQSDFINAITQDDAGGIWIGTNAGILKITDDTVDGNPLHSTLINGLAISVLHFDARGTLWIGTFGTGLFAWNKEKLTAFSVSNALPEETINSVLSDAAADIWIGTNRGVSRFHRDELEQFQHESRTALVFDRFNEADGMKAAETSGGAQPSAIRAMDDKLWFATTDGVVVVDPTRTGSERTNLHPVIEAMTTNASVFDHDLVNVHLRSAPAWIEFRFTAPELSSALTTEFRYRLNGVDDAWSEPRLDRSARYASPSPGSHVFEVQARRPGRQWSTSTASLMLQIDPRFFQTRWFLGLMIASIFCLLALLHYLRLRWIRMQSAVSEERRRIAGEIHDHLAQGFSGIAIQIDAAMRRLDRSPESARPHLQVARDVAVSSLTDARRSVWNLRESGRLGGFADKLKQVCEQIVWGSDTKIVVAEVGRPWMPKPLIELQLTRIAEEAVSNAVEHGRAALIEITIIYQLFMMEVILVDDGNGFDAHKIDTSATRGFGLTNMKHRVRQIGGTIQIVSSPGVGTKTNILVPRVPLLFYRSARKNNEKSPELNA